MGSLKAKKTSGPRRGISEESFYFNDFKRFAEKLKKRIITLRKEKGLTQEQIQDFELNLRQLQRIEAGETSNVTLATLYKLAKAFEISPSKLIDI